MTVHVHSIMRNEEDLLPYFLRYYETIADQIYIFNDHSTDRTAEIAALHPKVKVFDFEYENGLDELDFNACFTNSYKLHSRGVADWAMCVDADEFIYHNDIHEVLARERNRGKQLLKTTGYAMVSTAFPTTADQIYSECKTGFRHRAFDKVVVFDPQLDIQFKIGRHKVEPIDGVKFYRVGLKLLHYKYLSEEFFMKRSSDSFARRGWSDFKIRHRLRQVLRESTKYELVDVI